MGRKGIRCGRTDGGHRLYTRSDLDLLQQILSLRQLRFSLEQTKEALFQPNYSAHKTIISLRNELRRRRLELEKFDYRLAECERVMASGEVVSTEEWGEL